MKKLFQATAIAIALSPSVGAALDFEAGLRAAQSGDFETALKEWKPLAKQGDAQSQYSLGQMYSSGLGVPQDYTEAVKWFHKASEQGDAYAQSYLGYLYFNGLGIAQDNTEAVRLYKLAADQGLAEAQLNLGNKYLGGEGVGQDYVEARRWYRLAAEQGIGQAQYHLGYMYFEGFGVPQDYITAYMWSDIAVINGEETAVTERDEAAARLTSADITEAQRRAGVCIASNYQDCDQSTASAQQAGATSAQQEEWDAQRQDDILKISDMVEAYYEINNHYPWVKEPQAEIVNIFIGDHIPGHYPASPHYQLLEAELQKTLGNDAVLPKNPEDDGIPYQYATDGKNYYVAAYIYHEKPYAWEQTRHANKVEVTSRPNLKTQSHRPDYLRHVMKFGPDDADMQAELFQALQEHDFEKAAVMLKNGANPSPTCDFNHRCQPLATAAMEGDLELMKFLIDHGADLDGYNAYDDVALIYALENQQIEAAKLLVKSGANVNLPNAFGVSPFVGASVGDRELVTLMIENGGDLDKNYLLAVSDSEPGQKNMRPLEFAIKYDRPEIILLLLGAGADPSLNTSKGETIEELGRKSENKAIRELF